MNIKKKEYYLNNKMYFKNYYKMYYQNNREDILKKLKIKRRKINYITIIQKYTIFYFD